MTSSPVTLITGGSVGIGAAVAKGFARNGGIIELFTEENRLKFIINVDNARRAGLRISSRLLQLAATVEQGRP